MVNPVPERAEVLHELAVTERAQRTAMMVLEHVGNLIAGSLEDLRDPDAPGRAAAALVQRLSDEDLESVIVAGEAVRCFAAALENSALIEGFRRRRQGRPGV